MTLFGILFYGVCGLFLFVVWICVLLLSDDLLTAWLVICLCAVLLVAGLSDFY